MKTINAKTRPLKKFISLCLFLMLAGCVLLKPTSRTTANSVDSQLQGYLDSINKPSSSDRFNFWSSWVKPPHSIKEIKLGDTKNQVLQAYFNWANNGVECPQTTRRLKYRRNVYYAKKGTVYGGKVIDTFRCNKYATAKMISYELETPDRLIVDNKGNVLNLYTNTSFVNIHGSNGISYGMKLDQFEGTFLSKSRQKFSKKNRPEKLKVTFVQGRAVTINNIIPAIGKCATFYELLSDKYMAPAIDNPDKARANAPRWIDLQWPNEKWQIRAHLPCSQRMSNTVIESHIKTIPKQYYRLAKQYRQEVRQYENKKVKKIKQYNAIQSTGEIKL